MNVALLLVTIAVAFIVTVLISPIIIPFLRRLKFGQSIREEGPKSHMKKSGTPTMGGVMIIIEHCRIYMDNACNRQYPY